MRHPYHVLGVAEDAPQEEIRRAYLSLIQAHPPDRDAEGFREIHAAYELTKDEIARAKLRLFGLPRETPPPPLAELLPPESEAQTRKRIGLDRWIAAGQAAREEQRRAASREEEEHFV